MRADERGICIHAARTLRAVAKDAEERGDDDWLYRNQPAMSAYMLECLAEALTPEVCAFLEAEQARRAEVSDG